MYGVYIFLYMYILSPSLYTVLKLIALVSLWLGIWMYTVLIWVWGQNYDTSFSIPSTPQTLFIYDTTICIYYVRYLRGYNHMLICLYIIIGCIIGHCRGDGALCSSWKPIILSYHSTYDIMLLDYIHPGYNLIIQGLGLVKHR